MSYHEGVLHVVFERILGASGKDEFVLEQVQGLILDAVADASCLEGIKGDEDTL